MAFLSFHELIDIVIMSLLLGFLFKDSFRPVQRGHYDPLRSRSSWSSFWFSTAVIAPAIILHELAHKFVAMSFGFQATFHAFYANQFTLFLGVMVIFAKLMGSGFLFLVPGYVEIVGRSIPPLENAVIAFAGPAVHALFWLGATLYLSRTRSASASALQFAHLTRYINGFLFVVNMLPLPGIDGFTVYSSLLRFFF